MTATNRSGQSYEDLARYYTQVELTRAILMELPIQPHQQVYEGHVGGGAWVKGLVDLARRGVSTCVEVADIDEEAPGLNESLYVLDGGTFPFGWWTVRIGDFLLDDPQEPPDWIPGNPPYSVKVPCPTCGGIAGARCKRCKGKGWVLESVAEKHVRRALELVTPQLGSVVYLLRSAFAESQERYPFWMEYPARHRWDLSERPSFDGEGGTDSCAYSVFWWDLEWIAQGHKNGDGTWEVLKWR